MELKLLTALNDAANSAGVKLSHMQSILSCFLREIAPEHGYTVRPILIGLADEISESL